MKASDMTQMNAKLGKMIIVCLAAISLTACAGGGAAYQPIVDGPIDAAFQKDVSECQALAEQRGYNNSDVRTGVTAGAVVGGVAGLLQPGKDSSNALVGALVGGGYGGGGAALGTRAERKNIVKRCMIGRGHRVIG